MADKGVVFKATASGLIIVFDKEESFEGIFRQIEYKLDNTRFFDATYFTARYKGRKLNKEEEESISRLIAEKAKAKFVDFSTKMRDVFNG